MCIRRGRCDCFVVRLINMCCDGLVITFRVVGFGRDGIVVLIGLIKHVLCAGFVVKCECCYDRVL